jgi:CBS domain-containing protein
MPRVEALMTDMVVTVLPDVPVHEAARLMVRHAVGGLPVVDRERILVGIITRSDLTVRLKTRRPRWWDAFCTDTDQAAREYRRATGTTVREVMSRPVVTVAPQTPVGEAVARLDEHRIGRLPVVTGDRLAGILSRSDLIQALAAAPAWAPPRSDAELVAEMTARLAGEWWVARGIAVDSVGGVVRLYGLVDGSAQRAAIETMARATLGNRGVESHLVDRRTLPTSVV